MVVAEGSLRDFHRTTIERLGGLKITLWSWRENEAEPGTLGSIDIDKTLLTSVAFEECAGERSWGG